MTLGNKYVRFEKAGFICWPRIEFDPDDDPVFHSHMAEFVKGREGGEIISAGFFRIENNKTHCFGHSSSLGVGSLDEDSELLTKQLFT